MGKILSGIARCERDGFLFPAGAWRLRLLVLLLVALAGVAACADRDNASDNDQHGTFYGGVLGGLSR